MQLMNINCLQLLLLSRSGTLTLMVNAPILLMTMPLLLSCTTSPIFLPARIVGWNSWVPINCSLYTTLVLKQLDLNFWAGSTVWLWSLDGSHILPMLRVLLLSYLGYFSLPVGLMLSYIRVRKGITPCYIISTMVLSSWCCHTMAVFSSKCCENSMTQQLEGN